MKNSELYFKTINKLVQSYFDDTLQHNDCSACAVGNIVGSSYWSNVFYTSQYKSDDNLVINTDGKVFQEVLLSGLEVYEKNETLPCGYNWQQLAQIEFAFESQRFSNGDTMFNGLMAVVDALDIIHENFDTITTKETKSKFIKQLA